MKLEHSFTVPVGIEDAWKILLDIERIGPCMPGAAIDSVDGDDFTGTVKVKLGPIGLTYKGKASFIEKDDVAHRAVIDARGRDARGNGTASAKVTAVLVEAGATTTVQVNTDLDITGKPAQFGRGVMVDVGNKLIGQFADNLAATLQEDQDVAVAAAAAPAGGRPERSRSDGCVRRGRGFGGERDDTGGNHGERLGRDRPGGGARSGRRGQARRDAAAGPEAGRRTDQPDRVRGTRGGKAARAGDRARRGRPARRAVAPPPLTSPGPPG